MKWFPRQSDRLPWLSVSPIKVEITNTASRTMKADLNFIFDVLDPAMKFYRNDFFHVSLMAAV